MIAGYITYNELKLITGFSDYQLKNIITEGIKKYALNVYGKNSKKPYFYKDYLYDLQEVEEWIRMFIF